MLRRCIERTIPNLDIYLLLFLYNRIFSFCHIVYYVILPSLKEDLWAYYRGAHFSYFDLTYHKKNLLFSAWYFFKQKKNEMSWTFLKYSWKGKKMKVSVWVYQHQTETVIHILHWKIHRKVLVSKSKTWILHYYIFYYYWPYDKECILQMND